MLKMPLYCLIGNPVKYSLSSLMHNLAFNYFDYYAAYTAFSVGRLSSAINFIKFMKIKGLSITKPYKSSIIHHLDYVDEFAYKIGAVNTVIREKDKLFGYNFDCDGAMKALLNKTKINKAEVLLIGAGGAAKSIGYGIKKHGGKLKILNRNIEKGKLLAYQLNATFCNLSELSNMKIDILINATPVGMYPYCNDIPISIKFLNHSMTVMDIVYNPFKTRLLKEANEIGCNLVSGLEMFLEQGALQFNSWTNLTMPIKLIRTRLLNYL